MCHTFATVDFNLPSSLSKSSSEIVINGVSTRALIDTCSMESFIHPWFMKSLNLPKYPKRRGITMAQSSLSARTLGFCKVDLELGGKQYSKIHLSILPGLFADLLLGLYFQKQHQSIMFHQGGPQPPLEVCGLSMLKVGPPELFANLTADSHPIATKSRRYSHDERKFIDAEAQRLLKEGIIEPSNSPWRVQVVVTRNENYKKRLVIDYSQTINRFTMLDAYPLPRIDDTVNPIAQYRVFSTIDICCTYHQVKINDQTNPIRRFKLEMHCTSSHESPLE